MILSVLDVLRRLFLFWIASSWLSFRRCLTELVLKYLMCFLCSGVNIEKIAMCVRFSNAIGWSRKLLICTICKSFCVFESTGQMRKSSSLSKTCED